MSVEQYSLVAHDWLNLEFIINDLTNRVVGQELGTGSSPTFGSGTITGSLTVGGNLGITGDLDVGRTLTLDALTASKLVATDASKGLESVIIGSSLSYVRPTLNTIQDIRTTATPTFAGLISTGVIRATDFAKTGWPVTPGVTLSFVGGTTRIFTVTDGGSAYYYIDGVKYILGENKTVVIDDLEGLWYIYFDGAVLTASQTIWSFIDEDKALVAYLHWARDVETPANGKSIFTGWEMHSFHMSGATHARLHYAGGARWETGLLVADNLDNTVDVSAGDIWDEDLNIAIIDDDTPTALFEQILSPAQLPIYYRDGASAWRIYETNEKAATTDVGYLSGGNLKWNDATGTWSNETVGLNNYVAYYVVATNEQTEPVALIMGQRTDNKLADAKVNNIFSGLSLTGLPFEEMVVLARLILKDTAAYTLEEVLDLRAYNIKGNITSPLITQHAGLGGLNWSSSGHYFDAEVDFNAQNITNIGTVSCGVITQSGTTLAATYQPLHANLSAITAGNWAGAVSIITLGTIATGTWQSTDVGIAYGGTGASTAQAAINTLSAVGAATNEHVLTKDTDTGNAIWKVAAGGGASTWIALTHTDPANYTGDAGKAVVVNAGEDGLEFGPIPGGAFSSKCSVYRNGNQTITKSEWTKIQFNAELYDTDGEFDSTTDYDFTVAATGYYHVVAQLRFYHIETGKYAGAKVLVNGVIVIYNTYKYPTTTYIYRQPLCVKDLYLEAGDILTVEGYHNCTINKDIYPNIERTYLTIHRFA